MSLTLKIIAPSKLIPGQVEEFTFDKFGGSIGRKPNNDFILLDPERFISSKHAIIEFNNEKYFITDTSTNGVFINNSKAPLGSGNSTELNNGDKISIGDFLLSVNLEATADSLTWDQPIATPQHEAGISLSDDLGIIDPLFSESQPAASDIRETPPPTGTENSIDPLAILDGGSYETGTPIDIELPSIDPSSPEEDSLVDDIFGNPHESIPEPLPINEPFTPPNVIPDDWDILADSGAEISSVDSAIKGGPHETNSIIPNDDDIFSSLEANSIPIGDGLISNATFGANQAPSAETPPATPQQTPHQMRSPAEEQYFESFLQGAGIDSQRISVKDKEALMRKVGLLMRSTVEGLMTALRARSTIKSSFRVNKTTISPVENNPLKFLVTADDALNTLLSDDKSGYMSAEQAFEEGFKDLHTHQLALMAGMQATINAIVTQFDPVNLEHAFDSQNSSGSLIPGHKKAKNWDSYIEFHAKLSDRLLDDFQNVYGEEFAHAYEVQINKLM